MQDPLIDAATKATAHLDQAKSQADAKLADAFADAGARLRRLFERMERRSQQKENKP
jgi:hypothetical protein